MKCEYGCNQEAKYTTKGGKNICESSPNKCPVNRAKNTKGLKTAYKEGKREVIWTDEHRDKSHQKHLDNCNKVVEEGNGTNIAVRRYLLERIDSCQICGIKEWQNKPISFEIDHINGYNRDNRLENLRVLCPNCHSQTDNFRGRNINKGVEKVTDEEILEAIKTEKNIRQVLIKVGLAPKGGNYNRVKRLRERGEIGETQGT